jgi:hypothetical protein
MSQWTDSLDSKKQMGTQLENLLFVTGERRVPGHRPSLSGDARGRTAR